MNIIAIGPQGSGKGTQAKKIAEHYHMEHLSTGRALRQEARTDSELGKKIRDFIDAGEFAPEEIVNDIIKKAIEKHEKKGIIFDGYPRSVEQARFLETLTQIDALVDIVISDKESIQRITSRLVCPTCGKNYNSITLPPKVEGKCDIDNETLIQRKDDTKEAVKKRLAAYHKKTEPLIQFYKEKNVSVHIINGEQPIEAVFEDIKKVLK